MKTAVFIDSGIGGIPYLTHAADHIPDLHAIYCADTGYFPYGTKSPEALKRRLVAIAGALVDRYDPDVFVIACNTASVVGLDVLRKAFSVPFVGTVPAVKPAVLQSRNRKIGIMATEQTLQDPYLEDLIQRYGAGSSFVRIAATGLIERIEHGFFDKSYREELLQAAQGFSEAESDTVVLGCTHFLHLSDELEQSWNGTMKVVDSREGITRQILRILEDDLEGNPELNPLADIPCSVRIQHNHFWRTSKDRGEYYGRIAEHFCMTNVGVLDVN